MFIISVGLFGDLRYILYFIIGFFFSSSFNLDILFVRGYCYKKLWEWYMCVEIVLYLLIFLLICVLGK